jgi:hypothetical protein
MEMREEKGRIVAPAKAGTHGKHMQGQCFWAGMDFRMHGNDAAESSGGLQK